METNNAAHLMDALGHESRLMIFRLLVKAGLEGMNAGAIGENLALPAATLSFHLAHLGRVGLIRGRQEGRYIFYVAEFGVMDDLLAFLSDDCCQGKMDCLPKSAIQSAPLPVQRVFNVLFLCTGNSARSILAECVLNQVGKGRFRAWSAGSHPTGQINPQVLKVLEQQGIKVSGIRSKSWHEFSRPDAPAMDFVITVCDRAAGEVCPVWPGQPVTAHWGIEDPAGVAGDEETKRRAAVKAMREISTRISLFVSLPFRKLDALSLQQELNQIGGKLRDTQDQLKLGQEQG